MSFKLKVRVKNLGTIKEADIDFNSITIFGGANNTGKSYVSKFLYSLLDALDADIERSYLIYRAKDFQHHNPNIGFLPYEIVRYAKDNKITLNDSEEITIEIIQGMIDEIEDFYHGKIPGADEIDKILNAKIKPAYEILNTIHHSMEENANTKPSAKSRKRNDSCFVGEKKWLGSQRLPSIIEAIADILNYKNVYASEELIRQTYKDTLEDNLKHNFQIYQLQNLIHNGGTKNNLEFALSLPGDAEVDIVCKINSQGKLSLHPKSIGLLAEGWRTQFSKVVYLESPIYWKMEKALSRVSPESSNSFRRSRNKTHLRGVPKYFYDLQYETLSTPDLNNAIDKEVLSDEASKLPGKIVREKSFRKELIYTSNEGKVYKLHNTATGIVQLGILMYLVESHVIGKGTIIFYDESEANIHPKWQKVMIRVLHKLAENGVHMILATYSPDIIQWISTEMKRDKKINDILAINNFSETGIVKSQGDNKHRCRKVLEELTDPFAEEFFRGLRPS